MVCISLFIATLLSALYIPQKSIKIVVIILIIFGFLLTWILDKDQKRQIESFKYYSIVKKIDKYGWYQHNPTSYVRSNSPVTEKMKEILIEGGKYKCNE